VRATCFINYAILTCLLIQNGLPAQSNFFFKQLSSDVGLFDVSIDCDTLSKSSFLIGGVAACVGGIPDTLKGPDSYLIKNNIGGLTKWIKRYRMPQQYLLKFRDFKVLKNKDILVGGSSYHSTDPYSHQSFGILLLLDSNGYLKWSRKYLYQEIFKVLELSDGCFAIATSDSSKSYKIAMLDPSFNLKWCKKFVHPYWFTTFDLIEGPNKNVVSMNYSFQGYSFLILTDSLGNKIQDLKSTNYWEGFYSGIHLNNGYYAVGARMDSFPLYGTLFKLDHALNVKWFKGYFPNNQYCGEFLDISAFNNNNILITAEPEKNSQGSQMSDQVFVDSVGLIRKAFKFMSDTFVSYPHSYKILDNSTILFTSQFGLRGFGITDTVSNHFCGDNTASYVLMDSIHQFIYNTFTPLNSTFTYSNGSVYAFDPIDLSVNYYCSSGPTGPLDPFDPPNPTGIEEGYSEKALYVFPNPVNEYLFIQGNMGKKAINFYNSEVTLVNTIGEIVYKDIRPLTDKLEKINVKDLPNGLYLLSVISSRGKKHVQKVLVAH
jgi:Secretion system C-terminal sorting domain